MDTTLELLTLALLPDVGPRCVRALRARGPLAHILGRPREHADLLPATALGALVSGAGPKAAQTQLRQVESLGGTLVGLDDPAYPPWLARIYDPPAVLFVRGRLLEGEGPAAVAVVGSRAATPQGQAFARQLARDLAACGACVVSGLARGIDAASHRGALDAGGRTVAVLGSGLDRLYPREHAALADAVVSGGGALVTEFPCGVAPSPGHFPRRNRVIAGWSRAVVVVEAAERSGALVTAREALDNGREVLAVPGHPGSAQAGGTNALIRDGARLVRHARDVAEELGWTPAESTGEAKSAKDGLLACLQPGVPASVEELGVSSRQPAAAIWAELVRLESRNLVRRLPGALFVRT